ncbi:N-acetylglucosaminyldiphosphoundecaprenol N-acetyl-beta-D-mannosaminyltransferase [Flavobacterium sp. CG_23.5]|uniref:WecB/TagA/CpsF family glycosyltransferase n=1 Tax=Flavobacterium sp. CG_23.5 TaxID=2760708 RepID=UPI001AEB054D|nr:WecB/TagA/CpsF family glycosyltransferase [Flavobacterium sp. CG_23.5]MBP2283118.1 N-acetylglucosaminyldiphosphoundecaprenol N-acetyl-beta-D-mannosaminyltransferase [Flavobacterium sp. CG_23.5]
MSNSIPSVPLVDYSIYTGSLKDLLIVGKTLINTINQYSFCIAETDTLFKTALQGSDILLPDGMAIVAGVRLLENKKITKIAGADLHHFLLDDLNKKGGTCFYLGSSEHTLQKIAARLAREFPNVRFQTFSPVYATEFSTIENTQMLDAVNAFQPDVLFVGMTAPKQEKWTFQHKSTLDAKIICSIGAVFDFYAGTVVRPHSFWINLRLEWFVRLLKEPKRMWKRYLYYGPVFIKLILKEKLKRIFKSKY